MQANADKGRQKKRKVQCWYVSSVIVADTPTTLVLSVSDNCDERDDSILPCVREHTLDNHHAPDSTD